MINTDYGRATSQIFIKKPQILQAAIRILWTKLAIIHMCLVENAVASNLQLSLSPDRIARYFPLRLSSKEDLQPQPWSKLTVQGPCVFEHWILWLRNFPSEACQLVTGLGQWESLGLPCYSLQKFLVKPETVPLAMDVRNPLRAQVKSPDKAADDIGNAPEENRVEGGSVGHTQP